MVIFDGDVINQLPWLRNRLIGSTYGIFKAFFSLNFGKISATISMAKNPWKRTSLPFEILSFPHWFNGSADETPGGVIPWYLAAEVPAAEGSPNQGVGQGRAPGFQQRRLGGKFDHNLNHYLNIPKPRDDGLEKKGNHPLLWPQDSG